MTVIKQDTRILYNIVFALINNKADDYGKATSNPYGAQSLLEDTIRCLELAVEQNINSPNAVKSRIKELKKQEKLGIGGKINTKVAAKHLEDMMAVCWVICRQQGIAQAAIPPKEFIKHLQTSV